MLATILSISGKPGLFRLLSQGKGTLIVESLVDNKRLPVHAKDRVVSLGDITMYTIEDDMPLGEVLTAVHKTFEGKPVDLVAHPSSVELYESFGKCVPTFDRERVYASDVKKLFTWYNILLAAGFTTFVDEEQASAE